ncbi:hypothetical protein GO988_07515 [Hymenobacter sp. HMF4947]|uniref:Uncharacterized protein n=1 Tax=Hymenobacter ginkgonis TaxID=2682976 RepID=A0A7K1TCQ0_9BACT|nr:hypothetical protein [Hymenobacter ginkgonis]MVN76169.1 hypothetical protein [Hymenobacter ginkgonis]
MVRRLLLPLLGFALLATEAATAQKLPVKPKTTAAPLRDARTGRLLTARERRAAEAAAKVAAANAAAANTMAMATPAQSQYAGWSDEPMPQVEPSMKRPTTNLSVAPGMPINQVGHGVTTDYNGRPLNHNTPNTNTTLPSQR